MFPRPGGSDGKDANASPSSGSPQRKTQKTENCHPDSKDDFPLHEDDKDAADNNPDNKPILAAINRTASTQESAYEATQNVVRAAQCEVNERIDKL